MDIIKLKVNIVIMRKKWTPEELTYLKENFLLKKTKEVAATLNRPPSSINLMAWRMGLQYQRARIVRLNLESLSDEEFSYIAGLVDGEGSITFRHLKNGFMNPRVCISNTNPYLGDYFNAFGIYTYYGKPYMRHKPIYSTAINRIADVKYFLEKIVPFLKFKQEVANLVIEFCTSRLNENFRKPLTKREYEIVDITFKNLIKAPKAWVRKQTKITSKKKQPICF